jgi:hypothetical protein
MATSYGGGKEYGGTGDESCDAGDVGNNAAAVTLCVATAMVCRSSSSYNE